MELRPTAMVIADISGYTKFMSLHRISLLHAEVIITDLLEVVTNSVKFPLKLNRLEGDAAFLYCDELGDNPREAINDIAKQIVTMMQEFTDKHRSMLEKSIGGCLCDACQHIDVLRLKAFAHFGDVVIKVANGSIELGGEAPIVIHRMTKNSVNSDEYVMASADFCVFLDVPIYPHEERGTERYELIGNIEYVAYFPEPRMLDVAHVARLTRLTGIIEAIRLFARALFLRVHFSKMPFKK